MRQALAIALVGGLLAVPLPVQAGATHVLTIDHGTARFDAALEAFDFNRDGRKEIIAHGENRHVYVFDSRDGRMLADLVPKYPSSWGARSINPPEAEILVQGGAPHLVITNSAAYVSLFRYDGHWDGRFHFTTVWERRMTECHSSPGMDAEPTLHDLDGDGDLEIIVQTEEVGVYALRLDGSTMWKRCIGGGNGEPAVADMDFNGVPDVVFASDGGVVTRVDGRHGGTIWSFWAGSLGLGVASMPVGPSIGQINGFGALDVAVGARDSSNRDDPHANRAALITINGDNGHLMWMRQHPQGTPLTYTHPIIHDVDKNGHADILWADWNTVGHKPPFSGDSVQPWAVSGTPAVYRYDAGGNLRFRTPLESFWHNNDLALADVDGDGVQEIIADDGSRGMAYIDSRHGNIERHVGIGDWVATRGPVVYDLRGDGGMQWMLPVHRGSTGGIQVFETHVGYNAAWPHVPDAKAGSGGPPPSGDFQASFRVPSTTNNWWVEVFVDANQPVSRVDAVVNGNPVPLEKKSWGAWAKSFHVTDGSQVVFKARDNQNREVTSSTYTWGDASAPPPSGFDATFNVRGTTNNWWVETAVSANEPVSGVTATVNGGSPVALSRTDWGTWAKSFHVADGSRVVFMARSSGGATDSSQSYTWGDGGGGGGGDGGDGGDFTVKFTVPDSVNEWWVEVDTVESHTLAKVEARINGGSPQNLPPTSWGTWAKSLHAPRGSSVQFIATDVHGHTATSQTFTWLSGGEQAFTATFTPKSTTNNWWVEVKVDASRTVQSVDARVDGGAWRALDRTDWGTWAKSFHAPDGARVEFRASDGSATVTSKAYTWG